MQRLLLTFGTLLLLSGAYFPYAWGVGLLIRSGAAPTASDVGADAIPVTKIVREPIENERVARLYFPDQEWMQDAKIQLRDGNELFCYASHWEQAESKTEVRFEPFALVTFTKDGPLSVLAQTAVVKFQREIDVTSPSPGRILEAKLEGETVIRGANNLYVAGRHFVFSAESSRIWSDNAVKFAFDQHSGESDHGIQIDLVISDVNTEKKPLAIEDVKSVHLLRHVVMNLAMPEGAGLPGAATAVANGESRDVSRDLSKSSEEKSAPQNARDAKPKVSMVRIECEGSFRLDRRDEGQTAFAVFDEKVKVRRANENGKAETLEGQTLEVTFVRDDGVKAEPTDDPSSLIEQAAHRDSESKSAMDGVKFKPTLLVVRGTPAIFRSEESQSYGTMAYARYDAVQRTLALSNSVTNPSQLRRVAQHEAKPVYLKLGSAEIESQQIGLKHDADNNPREVVCRGAGWLRMRDAATQEEELHISWRDQLRKYQDATSPLDVIDVTGGVVIEQPKQHARITANYMKLWMEPLVFESSEPPSAEPAPFGESSSNAKVPQRLGETKPSKRKMPPPQPRRLWAVKDVVATTPQFKGTTQELAMWFEDVAFERRVGMNDEAQRMETPDLSFGKSPIRKVAGQQSDSEFEPFESEAAPQEPITIDSKLIRILVVGRGPTKQADVGEVYCEGGVTLTQPREDAPRPLLIKADQLHLRNQGAEKQVVHLLGQPARLDDPQLDLQGREIYFDRHRNLVWVDGQGELKLPITRDFEGRPMPQPQKLAITWNEQMVFDGLVATFTGRVIAGMQDSTMKCQKMEVRMRQRMKFEQGAVGIEKDPISTVVCRQEVEFDSRVIANSSLNQVRKGRAAAFAMNLKTGRAEAKGPGVLQVWRRGQGKIAGLAPIAVADSNRATRVKEGGWDFTQIEFADELIGLQEQRSTTCRGQVQVAYGPVTEPLEVFDVDRLPKDSFLVSCDSLQMTQPQHRNVTGKEMIELVAEGNAWLEGRSFSGQADVISYDSANDLFMLRSLGENDSELTRELKAGGNRVPTIAKTIQFSRSRNVVDVDKVRFSTGLQ